MPDLRSALSALAENFATEILAAIRSASLDELVGETTRYRPGNNKTTRSGSPTPSPSPSAKPAGRAPRRNSDEVQAALDKIITLVKTSAGLRSEDIRARTGLEKTLAAKAFALGRKKGVLAIRGEKRNATYSVTGK